MSEQQTAAAPAPAKKVARTKGTVREYETIYLTKTDVAADALEKIKERVRGVVEREGGRVIKFTTWGRKKTAFPIEKQMRAIFVHVAYLGDGRAVSEVERNLRNFEEVVKFQTIKLSDAVLPESRPTEADVVLEGDREDERPPREARAEGEAPEAAAEASLEAEGGESLEEKV